MTLADLRTLAAYNRWANERVFGAAAALSPEQLTQPLQSSFPTIRETLAHVVSAEWVWVSRFNGVSPDAPPPWLPEASAAALHEKLQGIEADLRAYLDALVEEDLARTVSFRYLSGKEGAHPLEELLLHLVNHSTYHRGQVAAMLRAVGAALPATDLLLFYGEQHAGSPPA